MISQLLAENESTYTCPEAQELPASAAASTTPASAGDSATGQLVGSSSQAPPNSQTRQNFASVSPAAPTLTIGSTIGCSLEAVHFPTLDLTRLQTSQAPPAAAAAGAIAEPEASAPRAKAKPPSGKVCQVDTDTESLEVTSICGVIKEEVTLYSYSPSLVLWLW